MNCFPLYFDLGHSVIVVNVQIMAETLITIFSMKVRSLIDHLRYICKGMVSVNELLSIIF